MLTHISDAAVRGLHKVIGELKSRELDGRFGLDHDERVAVTELYGHLNTDVVQRQKRPPQEQL